MQHRVSLLSGSLCEGGLNRVSELGDESIRWLHRVARQVCSLSQLGTLGSNSEGDGQGTSETPNTAPPVGPVEQK